MFLKALGCEADVAPKAMMNLGLVYQTQANTMAANGDLAKAKRMAEDSVKYIEGAKPLLDRLKSSGSSEAYDYIDQYGPLRLQGYRMTGQLHAGLKDNDAYEKKFVQPLRHFRMNRLPGKCCIEYWSFKERLEKPRRPWRRQRRL